MSLWKPTGRHWAALGIVVTLAALGAAPAPASDGVLACGGTNTWLSGGSNGNRSYTVYRFDNFSDTGTIRLDQVLVYSGDGNLICAFPDEHSLPGTFKYVLGPHEYEVMTTFYLHAAGCLDPPTFPNHDVRGVSLFAYWSFEDKGDGIPLYTTYSDIYQDLNSETLFNHMARGALDCKPIKFKK